jgi:putative heme-binding domain-containing protein
MSELKVPEPTREVPRSRRGIFALLYLIAAATVQIIQAADEHDPATEWATFQIADGFQINLFASETNGVIKPIQIRFDPQGRLWVIGSTVYPQLEPGQIPNDKILVLEDTNGDGKCDRTTVFAEGLMIPTGIELGDGGVYLGHGTELLFLKDNNGDLRADERRVLLRGFGTGDNHQNINSFLWGPGGELWFCQGLHTHSNVETPWGIVRMNQAGLWRFRPRLKKLEGFYGSIHEPQNPWGYVFTDWGEPIVIAGNNSSMIYPVPGLTSAHLDLPPHQIWKNGQGRKSSGADIVGTSHFPRDWQGVLITGGYINNAVWALDIIDDGSGFALHDRAPLIKSSSRNFRPVDVKFGPDGSLYICDWYNPIIGHYQASFRHPDRDKTHGRIWRVTAKERELTKPPRLAGASISELIEHLNSPDRWTRQFARRALADLPTDDVSSAVRRFLTAGAPTPHVLMEIVGVLQSHEAVNEDLVRRLASSPDSGARAYAASALARWADRFSDPLSVLTPLATDANSRVRLHAIVASSYIPKLKCVDMIAAAAELPTDKFIDYALKQAVYALQPVWSSAFDRGELKLTQSPSHLNLFLRTDPTPTLERLRQLTAHGDLELDEQLYLWRTLLQHGGPTDVERALSMNDLYLRGRLLPEIAAFASNRDLPPTARTEEVLHGLVKAHNPHAMRLAARWRVAACKDDLLGIAGDSSLTPGVRGPAIAALATFEPQIAAPLAAEAAHHFNSAELWQEIISSFLQRTGGPGALARAFSGRPPPAQLATAVLRIMNETGRRDEELLNSIGNSASASEKRRGQIPAVIAAVRLTGDAVKGREVYERPELGCVTCHAVKGRGGTVGPDLGALGTAQPVDFIINAILEPQKEIKEGFMSLFVLTKIGDEYQGYQVRESRDELDLRDVLRNQTVTIPKAQILQKKQTGSVMPAGLTDNLSESEFADLIRYLSELGR